MAKSLHRYDKQPFLLREIALIEEGGTNCDQFLTISLSAIGELEQIGQYVAIHFLCYLKYLPILLTRNHKKNPIFLPVKKDNLNINNSVYSNVGNWKISRFKVVSVRQDFLALGNFAFLPQLAHHPANIVTV